MFVSVWSRDDFALRSCTSARSPPVRGLEQRGPSTVQSPAVPACDCIATYARAFRTMTPSGYPGEGMGARTRTSPSGRGPAATGLWSVNARMPRRPAAKRTAVSISTDYSRADPDGKRIAPGYPRLATVFRLGYRREPRRSGREEGSDHGIGCEADGGDDGRSSAALFDAGVEPGRGHPGQRPGARSAGARHRRLHLRLSAGHDGDDPAGDDQRRDAEGTTRRWASSSELRDVSRRHVPRRHRPERRHALHDRLARRRRRSPGS